MFNKIKPLLRHAPLLSLVVISIFIAIANYRFGTYLSGWDTLHPEFNSGLYFERIFFGAWQEHQGLGAPASQAHAAELSRFPLLFLLDVLLPDSLVRYIYFFLMYILGGIGIYVFIRHCWFEDKADKQFEWAAALGGLFYLLNLGTLQHFYVPLEMFAIHFASIGFILYSIYYTIKYPSPSNFALFFLLQFLAAGAAHTATLFYMYMATVFVYAVILSLTHWKNKLTALKHVVVLGLLTIIANFFWVGPNLYYILRHSDYVTEAKITRQFSSEAFWQNQAFGEIGDVLIFKNFLFNWQDYNFQEQEFVPLFDEWQNHLNSFGYPFLIVTAVLCLFGLLLTFTTKNKRHSLALLSLFVIPVFFINNLNFPSNSLYILLQSLSETLSEALRFPFTKFSILLMAVMSVYFAHFARFLFGHFYKIATAKDKKYFFVGTVAVLAAILIVPSAPAFTGNLISPNMKVHYPEEYQQLFEWFESQPRQTRIAKFPLTSHFGWTYHQWPKGIINQGYQGAGFIWFGLPQPILDREFDRWAASNEYFYYELAYAVNQGDAQKFKQVLDKYDVSWLLFDESVYNTNSQFKKDYKEEFEKLVNQTEGVYLAQEFGFLQVYSTDNALDDSWVKSEPVTAVSTSLERVKDDTIFETEGNYISTPDSTVSYPFAELKSETDDRYTFNNTALEATSQSVSNGTLTLPNWIEESNAIPVEVYAQLIENNILQISLRTVLPEIELDEEIISLDNYAPEKMIVYTLELPDPESTYIVKLSNSYITFTPTTEPLYFGAFSFPLDTIPIELYSSTATEQYSLISGYSYAGVNCFTQQPSADISADTKGDTLFLFAFRNTACATKPQFHTIPGKGLLSLEYSYRSQTANTYTRVCLFKRGEDGCINQDEYYIDIASEEPKTLQVFEPIETTSDINVSFDVSAETDGKNIEYSDATLAYFPHLSTVEVIASDLLRLAPRFVSVPVEKDTIVTIRQPYGRDNELLSKKDLNEIATAQNCSNQGTVSFTPGEGKHIITAKDKGIACEYYVFDNIIPSQEYVAGITATNQQGKELLVNIFESEKTLIDEVFSKGTVRHNFWIDDKRVSDDLQIALQAHSYGKYQSVNEVLDVSVAPFPVSYISKMKIAGVGATQYPAAEIISSKRRANFWYTVTLNANQTSTFYLSQTFDPGWRAFTGGSVLPHVPFNSWANGWIVPAGKHTITLFYVPQLLEFSGLALVVSASLLAWLQFEFSPKDFFSGKPFSKYYQMRSKLFRRLGGK